MYHMTYSYVWGYVFITGAAPIAEWPNILNTNYSACLSTTKGPGSISDPYHVLS